MSKVNIQCVCGEIFKSNILYKTFGIDPPMYIESSLSSCPKCGSFYEEKEVDPIRHITMTDDTRVERRPE